MKKLSSFIIAYLTIWIIWILLYKFNIIIVSNSVFTNISAQLLILGVFIFFIVYVINRFIAKFNEKKLNEWLVIYNLILSIAIIMTIINKSNINSNFLIEVITNISYIGIGGCLLFGIYSIKELLKF